MNHLNVDDVRQVENNAAKAIDQFNHLPGYISDSALVNHPDVLKDLAKEGAKFNGYVGNQKIQINYDSQNPDAAVQDVRSKVVNVVQQVYKQVSFVYPQVVQNIINAVDVFNGGKNSLPIYSGNNNQTAGNENYGDEDCEEPAEEDCDDEPADEDCDEDNANAQVPAPAPAVVTEPCDEDGQVPAPAVVPCDDANNTTTTTPTY
ncbi:hypothetical protein BDF19DRAFT_431168 [Syncephalis fuscata]|nr:hypothetical protein BDF19DRAFT_431168 [Syncephalis fuscata]